MPLNQLAQHKRRLWLQAKLTCRHRGAQRAGRGRSLHACFRENYLRMAKYDSPT